MVGEKISPENEQHKGKNPWEQMAEDAPPFAGETATNGDVTPEANLERAEQKSISIMKDLLRRGEIDPFDDFSALQEYADLRGKALQIEKPVKIYQRWEYYQNNRRETLRYDPIDDKVFSGKWDWSTRAFHSKDGTFLNFPGNASSESNKPLAEQKRRKLEGHEAAYNIIDFIYTCEHELQHDVQAQRLVSKEVSYDALNISRDHVALDLLGQFTGDATHFYHNAHNDLFIEKDANAAADTLIGKIIPVDGSLANKIANPNDPSEHQHTVESILDHRQEEGAAPQKELSLTVSANKIGMPEKTYRGTAEEIVSALCDDALRKYPAFIARYPALSLEYNNDGSRRSLEEITVLLNKAEENGSITLGGQNISAEKAQQYFHRMIRNLEKK